MNLVDKLLDILDNSFDYFDYLEFDFENFVDLYYFVQTFFEKDKNLLIEMIYLDMDSSYFFYYLLLLFVNSLNIDFKRKYK